ncbi:hypothetical protein GYMLUDRAFT_953838 [Collybiopsis luxurians FD-317 M1]|nr:hypothetical protein GYMLUDRAFT_953838 [Collybiopsis luxurians FD-317 M1]
MVNQDKIDADLAKVENKITDAFALFDFVAHLSHDQLQLELQQAREQDQKELEAKLGDLSANDHRILGFLQERGARVEELLVAVLKCVQERALSRHRKLSFYVTQVLS